MRVLMRRRVRNGGWQKRRDEMKAIKPERLALEQWGLGMHSLLTGCA